ncbi:hypothetical protein IEQ34_014543 [Dendrobium chrysotoxum]|uniref:Uncharacterized protein n=1 Tax=Dendrobium chrysotoxum TaxID=161865 RepID=A0AAV7GKK8_DENCH|nr:hypothetical protein IEQ34_014543 [Dendrobium chrysotoxum]
MIWTPSLIAESRPARMASVEQNLSVSQTLYIARWASGARPAAVPLALPRTFAPEMNAPAAVAEVWVPWPKRSSGDFKSFQRVWERAPISFLLQAPVAEAGGQVPEALGGVEAEISWRVGGKEVQVSIGDCGQEARVVLYLVELLYSQVCYEAADGIGIGAEDAGFDEVDGFIWEEGCIPVVSCGLSGEVGALWLDEDYVSLGNGRVMGLGGGSEGSVQEGRGGEGDEEGED